MTLEDRVALLEATVNAMEERRRKLIPPELESNPNVQMVIKDCLQNYYLKMRDFAGARAMDAATTERNRLASEAKTRLEQKEREEMAELMAAIEYFERTGNNPPGYEFHVEIQQ